MLRLNLSRAAVYAAIVLLAACAEAPTGTLAGADTATPALNVYPAPVLTVTNSGGRPLISWSALEGATSYEVGMVVTTTQTNRLNASSTSDTDEFTLGSTTGTSYLDSSNQYLGSSRCVYREYPIVTRETWEYKVTATFAGGSSSATVDAPVNQC